MARDKRDYILGSGRREMALDYKALFEAKNDDIGPKNAFFWNLNAE